MAYAVILVSLAVATLALSHTISKRGLKLPPGPPADPVFGNVRQMPFENEAQTFHGWQKLYGDIIYAEIFGRSVIILNTLKAARDLLEKRGAMYSCRPRSVMIAEMMGWHSSTTNLQYGERLRLHRRWILDYFGDRAPKDNLAHIQREAVAQMLLGLLQTPAAFIEHTKIFSAGLVMRITYGHKVTSMEDEFVRLADEATEATVNIGTSHSGMLVDFIPILKYIPTWMPGASFKRRALEARVKIEAMHDAPLKMVREKMQAAGGLPPSFTSNLLAENEAMSDPAQRHDIAEIRGVAGTMYAAAMDTTSATITAFFLAMTRNPRVCAKAQAEIDSVIGQDRLVEIQDRASLPYVECIVNELFRWHIAVPLGIPHRLTADDHYRDFDLPNGAMILANAWAMSRDEETYENATQFNPERFEKLEPQEFAARDPKNFAFGFGRRLCPGKDFANANVWLLVASFLAAFNISPLVDDEGNAQIPPEEYTTSFVRHPKPFACKITPRSPQRAQQIMEAAFAAQ